MFKKSIKVIASAMAAVMAAATVLSTAAKADVMFDTYDTGAGTTSTTVYDNYSGGYTGTTVYDNYDNVYYDNYDNYDNYNNSYVTYDTYTTNTNTITIISVTYDANGNKMTTYSDGTVVYEMAKKADTTYDFDKVVFDSSDYVWSYSDLASAQRASGISIKAPDSELALFSYVEYKVISGDILQIRYTDVLGNEVVVRKAKGKLDISGDSTKYSVEKKETLDKAACILSGSKNGYSKAIAAKNGYCYSVHSNFAMSKSDMEAIIKAMVK